MISSTAPKRPHRKKARSRVDASHASPPHASPLYHHLVPAYHALWPAVSKRRIAANLSVMRISPGTEILEVGVGTGMSLQCYPKHASVTGVDLSEAMLAEAKDQIADERWDHIRVMPMNAEQLTFADDSFDLVTSFHTISVVNDPRAMMSEMVRVCRPGGRILLINHFRSDNPWIARVVDSAGNITKRLGWRTDLELDGLLDELPIRLDHRSKSNPWSLFTVLRATCKPGA